VIVGGGEGGGVKKKGGGFCTIRASPLMKVVITASL
jgi:hypothetical protein